MPIRWRIEMGLSVKKTSHEQAENDSPIGIKQKKEICDIGQWKVFCEAIRALPVILCVTPGASSELVYDAFLQEGITPQSIFCPDSYHALYGERINSDRMPDTEACVWCLVGARTDNRIDKMFEEIVYRQGGYQENVYLLTKIGCSLPDTGLRHMICRGRKVVLMGEKRVCDLIGKYCLNLGDVEVTYVADQSWAGANDRENIEAIWFYIGIPSKELPGQYRTAYEACRQNGIYLSRYFADHFAWYRKDQGSSFFTQEETVCMECLRQMQIAEAQSSEDLRVQDKKRQILFLAPEHSYIWYGVAPLFRYYMKRKDAVCTVVFPYVWNILKIGERNLKEMTENILEIRKCGGIVQFDNHWYPNKSYEVCYLNLGVSQWYYSGIGKDVREASRMVISLQSIAYHTHYYAGNDNFEGMFAEKHRDVIDYAVTSHFMAEWAAQKEEKWETQLLPLGYPRMDALFDELNNSRIPEQWKRMAEGKKVIYFNMDLTLQLFQYCCEYCRKDKAVLIWRPHPYDFDTPRLREHIEKLKEEKNIIIDTEQSYDAAFNISDALVTTFCSSILVNYLFTDKPVLILDKGYCNMKDNEIDFRDEAWYKASYIANDEDAGRQFIDMIMEGRDDKKVEKLPYRKFMQQGFDGKVCERIVAFVDGAFK